MASLYFTYSAMDAGKTAEIIIVQHNYSQKNMHAVIFKPLIDTLHDANTVESRIGVKKPSVPFAKEDNLFSMVENIHHQQALDCLLVDEAQFLTKAQVHQLTDIVDLLNIPVMCYGLRTDAFGEVFEGASYLLALADKIRERKNICFCGSKATMNMRIDPEGNVMREGAQIAIREEGDVVQYRYESVCRKHFKAGQYR